MVNQKAKLIELNNQYSVFNQAGTQIAAVNQVGQSAAKKVLRLRDQPRPVHDPQARDHRRRRRRRAALTRPRKVIKSTVIVTDGADPRSGASCRTT